jgi:FtsZ-binding cell division protein ZapB
MNRSSTIKALEEISQDIDAIVDDRVKTIQKKLLNLVEVSLKTIEELQAEVQRLRDENNRLKGEQGKPDIRKQTKDISSEDERNKNKKPRGDRKKKKKKKNRIKIDRVEKCKIDKDKLPEDAIFKGYQSVVVQDIAIKTDNIEFRKETYYSPSLNKTFMASLPKGYNGEFGPKLRQLVLSMNHECGMTESCIASFLENHDILIGAGTISRLLTQPPEMNEFYQEYKDIVAAGLSSTDYQQMDDTGARVKGKNYCDHILCNELYTSYFTRQNKDRLTIIDILTQGEMMFAFNEQAFSLMQEMKLPEKRLSAVIADHSGKYVNRKELDDILNVIFPDQDKHQTNRQILIEATAIAAYQLLPHATKFLLTDDAPQYNKISAYHALCWIHIGRFYKKLMPVVKSHRVALDEFITNFWDYYDQLLIYKMHPTKSDAERLSKEFDLLFSTETNYDHLNERIAKTKSKKDQLLLVLEFPFLPLHNNASELGARNQARRRDMSFHTMSLNGTKAKDTFMTLKQTAKKLAVNFYKYIGDRINKAYEMPSLADLIVERSQKMVLNSS